MTRSPATESELLERASALAGWRLGDLGEQHGIEVPARALRAKGLAGQVLERSLGANAGNRAEPDFPALGVELKTIPLAPDGRPTESTFVCSAKLLDLADTDWEHSTVWKKLRCVLFVPIEGNRNKPLLARRIGNPVLWRPNASQQALLREDWEILAQLVAAGRLDEISAHLGRILQIRPKAASGRSRRHASDAEGALQWTLPRGFYLRRSFTTKVLIALSSHADIL